MSLQGPLHLSMQAVEVSGFGSQQMRSQFSDTGPNTLGIGRQVKRAEWTDLAMTGYPFIGFDPHDRTVKDIDRFSA